MTILITGAAGRAGSQVVRALVRHKISARVLVRNPGAALWLAEQPGITVVTGDLQEPATLGPALDGVTRALLLSSPSEHMVDAQVSFIDAARAAGVPHIVKFSGREPGLGFDQRVFRGTRWHQEVEAHLERSGLAWTHLRPSQFMQNYLPGSATGIDPNTKELVTAIGDARLSPVDIADVAEIAVKVLAGTGHEKQAYNITGPEALTMTEVVTRISAATGIPFRSVDLTFDELRDGYARARLPAQLVDLLEEQARERRRTPVAGIDLTVHRALGVTPTTFAEFARQHAAEFGGADLHP